MKSVKQDPKLLMLMYMSLCFFQFSIETSKCRGSSDNTNYPYAKICVPDVVKNLNVKTYRMARNV